MSSLIEAIFEIVIHILEPALIKLFQFPGKLILKLLDLSNSGISKKSVYVNIVSAVFWIIVLIAVVFHLTK